MADFMTLDAEQQAAFDEWFAARPPLIQDMIRQWPPTKLYRLKDTGHRVFIISYEENRTVTVTVSSEYNRVIFERNVFGIPIDKLEECDLPGSDEVMGVVLTDQSDIDQFIERDRDRVMNQERE